jgi:hypothetical protein
VLVSRRAFDGGFSGLLDSIWMHGRRPRGRPGVPVGGLREVVPGDRLRRVDGHAEGPAGGREGSPEPLRGYSVLAIQSAVSHPMRCGSSSQVNPPSIRTCCPPASCRDGGQAAGLDGLSPASRGRAGWVHRPLAPSGCADPSGDSGAAMSRRTDPTIGATSRNPAERGTTGCSPIGVARRNPPVPRLGGHFVASVTGRGPRSGPQRGVRRACPRP